MSEQMSSVIIGILAKHTEIDRETINVDTPLESLGVDSLLMVEIIFDLEERFNISIPDAAFVGERNRQFETVADIVRIVRELMDKQTAS